MDNKILHGDCLNIMKDIASRSVRMIFVDFPYGSTNARWDMPIDLIKWWKEAERVLFDNGVVVATAQVPFGIHLGASRLKYLRYEWIWEKTNATGHLNARRMPMKAHENALVFYKKLPIYNPQKTTGHERKVSLKKHQVSSKKTEIYGNFEFEGYDSTERFPRSVLKFPSDKQKTMLHPTQKPVSLVEYFIKTYSNEGDTILDPCAGSGTTGVAAKNTGRKFILIEKDEHYFEICKKRIADI
jgi:site-specific DNA-methyltransferase (adenine-specific)